MSHRQSLGKVKDSEWADLAASDMQALFEETRTHGWREALKGVENRVPFFVKRMKDLALLNWHMLLLQEGAGTVLDVALAPVCWVLQRTTTRRSVLSICRTD